MQDDVSRMKRGGLGANLGGESWERGKKRIEIINNFDNERK